jgi:O-antigen/teichoic acid export membrane protein
MNTAVNLGGQATILILVLLSTPYLVHQFGTDLYGAFVLLLTYVEVFSLLDLGISTCLVKYIAELLPQKRLEEINRYVGTTLTLTLLVGMVIGGSIALSANAIVSHLINVPADLHRTITFGFWIATLTFVLRFVGQIFSAVVMAAQRFDMTNTITIGAESFRLLGSVAVVFSGHLLEAVMLITLLASAGASLASAVIAQRLVRGLSWRPRFSAMHARAIIHFSKYVVIANTSARIVHSMDKALLGYFFPAASVAFYSIPYAISQQVGALTGNITSVVLPAASTLSGGPSDHRLQELYLRASKIVVASACFPTLVLALLSREVLTYWIDPEFAQQGAILLQALSLAFFINCLGRTPYVVAQAIGYPQLPARFSGLNAALNIILFLSLIPIMGALGAAMGFLCSQLIVIPWFLHATNRLLGISWTELIHRGFWNTLLAAAPAGLLLVTAQHWISSLLSLGLTLGIGLAIYLVLVTALVLDKEERAICWAVIDRCLPLRAYTRRVGH